MQTKNTPLLNPYFDQKNTRMTNDISIWKYNNLQEHVDLVNVTGGDIALDKCDFYHIQFRFKHGEAECVAMCEQRSSLTILDPNTGCPISIKQMD